MQQPPPPPPPPLPTKKHKYKNVTRSCLPPKQTHEKENINRSRAQAARQRIKKNKHIKNKKIHKVPGPIRKAEDSPWTQEKGLSMAPLIWDRAQAKKNIKKHQVPGPIRKAEDSPWTQEGGLSVALLPRTLKSQCPSAFTI